MESVPKSDLLDQKAKNNQNRVAQQAHPQPQYICETDLFDQKGTNNKNGSGQYRCESDLFNQQLKNNKNGFVQQTQPQTNHISEQKIKNTFEMKGYTANEAKNLDVKCNNEAKNYATSKNSFNETSNFKGNNWAALSNPRKPVEELLGLELSSDDDRILLGGERRREEKGGIREEEEDEEGVEEEGEGEEEQVKRREEDKEEEEEGEEEEEDEIERRGKEKKGLEEEKYKEKGSEIKLIESNERNIENLVSFAQSINSEQMANTLSLNRNFSSNEKPYISQNERRSPQINGNSPNVRKNYHLEKSNKNSDSSSKKIDYYERDIENLVSFAHSANSEKAKAVLNQNSNEKINYNEENHGSEANNDYIPVTFYNQNPINYEMDKKNNNRPYFYEEIKKNFKHSPEKNTFTAFEHIEAKPLFQDQPFKYINIINESNIEKKSTNNNYTIKVSGLISKKSSNASFKIPPSINNIDSPYKKNDRSSNIDYYNNESLKQSPFSANSQNEEERSSYLSPKFEEKEKNVDSSEKKENYENFNIHDIQNNGIEGRHKEIYSGSNYNYQDNHQDHQEECRNYGNYQYDSQENHENEEIDQDNEGEKEEEQHEEEEENQEFNSKYISDYYKINKSYSKLNHSTKSPKDLEISGNTSENIKRNTEEQYKNYYENKYLLSQKVNLNNDNNENDKIEMSDKYLDQYNYNSKNNNGSIFGEESLKPMEFNITENNEPVLPSICYKSIDCEKGRSFADFLLNTEKLKNVGSASEEKLEDSNKFEIEPDYNLKIKDSHNLEIYPKTFDFKSDLPEPKSKPFDLMEGERDKYIDDILAKYKYTLF